jgi:predicted anti-sigma-YlaC factor YlaD
LPPSYFGARAPYVFCICLVLALPGCGLIKKGAISSLSNTMSKAGVVYAQDEDPELVADAFPFMLKTMEGLLESTPDNKNLLIASCEAFTSYTQAFVAMPADVIEEDDLYAARAQRERAGKLFVRAREYGLRALEVDFEGITEGLHSNPDSALAETTEEDIPALFWTGAAWALAISNNMDDMDMVADFNIASALLRRAEELDPDWNGGAIHEVMISLEMARPGADEESEKIARGHFQAAIELSEGQKAGPYISLAEAVSIKNQDVEEFQQLLGQALEVDPDEEINYRLTNVLAQRRARWLLERTEDYFIEYEPEEEDL